MWRCKLPCVLRTEGRETERSASEESGGHGRGSTRRAVGLTGPGEREAPRGREVR